MVIQRRYLTYLICQVGELESCTLFRHRNRKNFTPIHMLEIICDVTYKYHNDDRCVSQSYVGYHPGNTIRTVLDCLLVPFLI